MNCPWNFLWKLFGLPAFCMSQLESSLSEFPSLGGSSFHIVATGRPVWSNPVSNHIFTGLPHFRQEERQKKSSAASSTRNPVKMWCFTLPLPISAESQSASRISVSLGPTNGRICSCGSHAWQYVGAPEGGANMLLNEESTWIVCH